jgi:hypothetical protein
LCFTRSALLYGFLIFQETGGNGPKSMARLDGATANEDLIFPDGDAAGDDPWILVMDDAAGRAGVAG